MIRHARRTRGIACCLGAALALIPADASAIFIVNQPWIMPAAKGQSTAAYMDLTSTEGATLVAARSDAAGNVNIAVSKNKAGRVASLSLPAGKMLRLQKGGYRLVLNRLTRTISLGDRVVLTLTIEARDGSRQEVRVNAEARHHSPLDDERRAHHHENEPN